MEKSNKKAKVVNAVQQDSEPRIGSIISDPLSAKSLGNIMNKVDK